MYHNKKLDHTSVTLPQMSTKKVIKRPSKLRQTRDAAEAQSAELQQSPAAETDAAVPETLVLKSNKRRQTNKALGISISSARVRRHMDKLNLNNSVDTMVTDLKQKLAALNLARDQLDTGVVKTQVSRDVDGKKTQETLERPLTSEERESLTARLQNYSVDLQQLQMRVEALTPERTRFSTEASIVLAIISHELTKQLATHAMCRVLAAKKKIIQINHLHEQGVEMLPLYPLVKSLPSFVQTSAKLAHAAREAEMADFKAQIMYSAEKDFKKKYGVHASKKKKVDEPAQVVEPVVEKPAEEHEEVLPGSDEAEDSQDSKTSFQFYVGQICRELVNQDSRYKAVRISTEIRSYLSDLLVEFIQRLSTLVYLTATCMKNKTINDTAIMKTVEMLLVDGHKQVDTIELKELAVYDKEAMKAEVAKKVEEKKAGRDYKINFETLPKVPGMVAQKVVTYPTSGYADLYRVVNDKLAKYSELLASESLDKEEVSV